MEQEKVWLRPHQVQMINNNYYILNDRQAKQKYPHLYAEVLSHDKVCTSSWYDLTDKAFAEYQKWLESRK